MANVLIRGISEEALKRLDAEAAEQGLSRNEYLRRQLEGTAPPRLDIVFTELELRRSGEAVADLLDDDLMDQAWR